MGQLIRVKMATDNGVLICPIPTGVMVGDVNPGGIAIFEIPEADMPPELLKPGQIISGMSPQNMGLWVAHIDHRYREHAGQYHPVSV